jgi:hypothetical protein
MMLRKMSGEFNLHWMGKQLTRRGIWFRVETLRGEVILFTRYKTFWFA